MPKSMTEGKWSAKSGFPLRSEEKSRQILAEAGSVVSLTVVLFAIRIRDIAKTDNIVLIQKTSWRSQWCASALDKSQGSSLLFHQ